ncbi:MAG: hypothetical protein IKE90_02660 [Bacilli bacterium]|nr:hypothetical protein [Bacilli bacterium]
MKSKRDKRNYIIIGLCMILVVMGVGYAAFSSLLTINGTANITNSWCVGFDNTKTNTYTSKAGVTGATEPTGSISYSGTACGTNLVPASSLTAHFYQPGDEIEYTLTIVNKSTVTAAIKSILVDNESVTSNTTKKKNNITYIVNMPESTTLAPNASTTMTVIAKFQNETDVTGNVNGQTETIEVKINTEQDDGTGGMIVTEPKFTGTIYRWSYVVAINGSTIKEKKIYNVTSDGVYGHGPAGDYETLEACESDRNSKYGGSMECKQFDLAALEYTTNPATLGKNYYLKHDVVEDIITASYVCFVYNNAEHCMKGGDGGASFTTNTQIIKDYQTFYNLNTVSNTLSLSSSNPGCKFTSSNSNCIGGGVFRVEASSDGGVDVAGTSPYDYCQVHSSGSNCPQS